MTAIFARTLPSSKLFSFPTYVVICGALLGCNDDRGLIPVSGRATYDGGKWPMPGAITFTPHPSAGGTARPGSARFDIDGEFVVGSFAPGDGLMPGAYSVAITCIDPLDFSKPREELDFVPSDYKPEDLVVEADMDPIVLNYDVPKKDDKNQRR